MKNQIGAILALTAAFAGPAPAAPWHIPGGGLLEVQAQRERPGGLQRKPLPQPQPQRDSSRNERPPDRGWLTEEERRDLRRDIDRANREIYKGRLQR